MLGLLKDVKKAVSEGEVWELAQADQIACCLREVFAELGVDLDDPVQQQAVGAAFVVVQEALLARLDGYNETVATVVRSTALPLISELVIAVAVAGAE